MRDDRDEKMRSGTNGYCAVLSFLHSYENFGSFDACIEFVEDSSIGSCSSATASWKRLDSLWSVHESVPRAVPFAYIPKLVADSRGKISRLLRIRVRIPLIPKASGAKVLELPKSLTPSTMTRSPPQVRVFITGINIYPAAVNKHSSRQSKDALDEICPHFL